MSIDGQVADNVHPSKGYAWIEPGNTDICLDLLDICLTAPSGMGYSDRH